MHMDAKLKHLACQQLSLFVDVCDHTLNLRNSKRFKFSAMAKVLFLNDDGIQDLLGRMQRLNEKELGLVSSKTLLIVSNVERGVGSVAKDVDKISKDTAVILSSIDLQVKDRAEQRSEKDEQKWKRTVLRALEFDDGTEPERVWETRWNRHRKETVKGTGDWIETDAEFMSWIKGSDPAMPVLCLEGGDGAGKTQLAANIIMRLQQGPTSRSTVAYYFMDTDPKARPLSKTDVAAAISRSLLWQLVAAYPPFLKSAAAICEMARVLDGPLDMWTRLLLNNDERASIDDTVFLVLDGLVEDGHVGFLIPLLQKLTTRAAVQDRVRVLITVKPSAFAILEKAGGIGLQKIKLGQVNLGDIDLYIKHHMDDMDMLQDSSRSGVSEMRDKILRVLRDSTGGDYRKMGVALDNISKIDEVDAINRCLEDAGNAAADQIVVDIAKLDQTCTPKEVSDINELILWTTSGFIWFTPLQMEAALSLKASGTTLPAASTASNTTDGPGPTSGSSQMASLSSLGSKIRKGRYPIFQLSRDDDTAVVQFKIDFSSAKQRIPVKKRDTPDDASSSGFREIQPVEVAIVKHYLITVCPRDVYDKFGFDDFFKEKLVRKTNYICQDPDNADLTLALRCLKCLVEQRVEKTETLYDYAASNVYWHLFFAEYEGETDKDITGDGRLSLADRTLRAQVGSLLVRLFTEDYAIDSLFGMTFAPDDNSQSALQAQDIPFGWRMWAETSQGIQLLPKYFTDRAVLQFVKDSSLAKAFGARSTNDILALTALLEPASRRAAQHLQRADATSRELENAFLLLLIIRARLDSKKITSLADRKTYLWNPTLGRIGLVESWAQDLLNSHDSVSTWEANMASLLLRFMGDHVTKKDVETRTRKALKLDDTNWRASYTLAQVTESNEEAIGLLHNIIDRLSLDKIWLGNPENKFVLADMFLELGNKYWNAEQDEGQSMKAVEAYSRSLELDMTRYERYIEITSHYAERGLWHQIASFLETLQQASQDKGSPLGRLISHGAHVQEFGKNLVQTAKSLDRWDLLRLSYEMALKERADDYDAKFWIRQAFSTALRSNPKLVDEGFEIWEEIVRDEVPAGQERMGNYAFDSAVANMIPAYTKRALTQTSPSSGTRTVAPSLAAAASSSSSSSPSYGEKIEALYKRFLASQRSPRGPETALYFSRYFFLQGDVTRAKESARELAVLSLEMMSNDDPADDRDCYWRLQSLFSAFGAVEDARAAWDMMAVARKAEQEAYLVARQKWEETLADWEARKTAKKDVGSAGEETKEETKGEAAAGETHSEGAGTGDGNDGTVPRQGSDTNDDQPPPEPEAPNMEIGCYCDGCGHSWVHPSALWTCIDDCGQIQFDDKCYEKLQNGTLERGLCDKDHSFFYIPDRDIDEVTNTPKGKVRINGSVLTLEEWKLRITAEYVDFAKAPEDGAKKD